ncbi:MAG: hypothetical protein AB7S80_14765 [Rhizobiaceae bacterium]
MLGVISQVEQAAKRMGSTGHRSWGIGFQKQLDALKLTSKEIGAVQKSWIALHDDMKQRSIKGALKGAEVSHWKTQTISQLAQMRGDLDRHFKAVETRARGHANKLSAILKPALVLAGAYTLPYFGGMMAGEALSASSERRREIFRQRMAGIPQDSQDKLFDKSEGIGAKYPSVPITAIMEMSRSAYSVMGDADRAAAIVERMVESLVVLQSARGPEAATKQLIGLIRGLDNLGVNKDGQKGIDQVNALIDAATRAAQVDPDFDPATWFEFARSTKTAGPALSMDFLARAPVYIQDMGSGATGNSLAMAFKAFVLEAVGSAGGKKYLQERDRIGVRKDGQLVDAGMFGSDPDQWVLKYLVPALQKDGVNLDDDTAVAAAVGKLSGNTTATGFLTRIITQRQQVERWLELMNKATGPESAKDVRFEDPFVGWESFKSSLENLSASLVPISAINAGLNSLADGINALAAAAEDNPLMTAGAMAGGGAATWMGGKWLFGKMGDLFGLKASAVALDGSAAALTRAAIALGGAGVADGLPGSGGKVSSRQIVRKAAELGIPALFAAAFAAGAVEFIQSTSASVANDNRQPAPRRNYDGMGAEEIRTLQYKDFHGQYFEGGRHRALAGAGPLPADYSQAVGAAETAGQQIESALSVTATPTVNAASIDAALAKARQLVALMERVGAAASGASKSIDGEMRRNFSD